jgi:hypothetical protein
LIFDEQFGTREEAFAAERRIKGWSRAKKLPLARGEWDRVTALAAIRSPDRGKSTCRSVVLRSYYEYLTMSGSSHLPFAMFC